MPSRDEHLAKADGNAALAAQLAADHSSPEWATTVLFYRAVHLVEAWFALRGVHNLSHHARSQAVYRDLGEIASDYADLLEASRIARYEQDGMIDWPLHERLREGADRIEAHVRAALR